MYAKINGCGETIDGYSWCCDYDVVTLTYIFVVSNGQKYVKYKIPEWILYELNDDIYLKRLCFNMISSMILELKKMEELK